MRSRRPRSARRSSTSSRERCCRSTSPTRTRSTVARAHPRRHRHGQRGGRLVVHDDPDARGRKREDAVGCLAGGDSRGAVSPEPGEAPPRGRRVRYRFPSAACSRAPSWRERLPLLARRGRGPLVELALEVLELRLQLEVALPALGGRAMPSSRAARTAQPGSRSCAQSENLHWANRRRDVLERLVDAVVGHPELHLADARACR